MKKEITKCFFDKCKETIENNCFKYDFGQNSKLLKDKGVIK